MAWNQSSCRLNLVPVHPQTCARLPDVCLMSNNRVSLSMVLFLKQLILWVVKRQIVLLLVHPRNLFNQGCGLEASGGSEAAAGYHPRTRGGQEACQAGSG